MAFVNWRDPETGRMMRFASKRAKRRFLEKRQRAAVRAAEGVSLVPDPMGPDCIHNGLARDAASEGRNEKKFSHRALSSAPRGGRYEARKPIGPSTILEDSRKRESSLSQRKRKLMAEHVAKYGTLT